jgi:hypothetical protein
MYRFIQVKVLQRDCLSLQSVSITTESLLQAVKQQMAPFLEFRRQVAPFSSQPTSYSFHWWAMNAPGAWRCQLIFRAAARLPALWLASCRSLVGVAAHHWLVAELVGVTCRWGDMGRFCQSVAAELGPWNGPFLLPACYVGAATTTCQALSRGVMIRFS